MADRKSITVSAMYWAHNGAWPVDVSFVIPPKASEVKPIMDAITIWLENAGFTPAGAPIPPAVRPLPQPGQEGTFGAVNPSAVCPVHGGEMVMSQYKTKDGKDQLYCPKKDEGGYCKQRMLA